MYFCSPSFSSCTSASTIYPGSSFSSTQNRHRYRAPPCLNSLSLSKTLQNPFLFPRNFNNSLSLNELSRPHSKIRCRCSHETEAGNLPWRGIRVSDGVVDSLAKPVAFALFWMILGLCPIHSLQPPAVAIPGILEFLGTKKDRKKQQGRGNNSHDHEYSAHTRRLLEKVSLLLKAIKKGSVKDVKEALKEVKSTKEELQQDIISNLHALMDEMGSETDELLDRSKDIQDSLSSAKEELEYTLTRDKAAAKDKADSLERELDIGVKEYNAIQEKLEEIEDNFLRRESIALNIGVRELCFIERECELLVKNFLEGTRSQHKPSVPRNRAVGLSRLAIQNDLEAAQKEYLKQLILRGLLRGEGTEPLLDQDSPNFVQRIAQSFEDSKNLQKELEAKIRKDMKKFGDEKWFLVTTPVEEVVKGFPEIELKWMFGHKEVVVPKGISLYLFHGWRKWREERKADLKRELLENVDRGKQYVKQRQERIILDRDRVVANTWFNEEKHRWEIDPVAVPYAVSRKLVEYSHIRHDWGAMFISIKGDDKEYYIDIKEYEVLFEDFGGFDGLYLKMLASGTPTSVQLMPIPLSELNLYQQFVLIARLSYAILNYCWKMPVATSAKDRIVETVKTTAVETMVKIVIPLLEHVIPYLISTPSYLKWRFEMEKMFKSRIGKRRLSYSYPSLIFKIVICVYVLFHVLQIMRRQSSRLLRFLGFGPLLENPAARKLQKLKIILKLFLWTFLRRKRRRSDPLKTAFENMKRVRNPPIPLKDFASIGSVKEEIDEVIAFLRNPYAFQKLGARAPRGVLIVGEQATGKTSLALAIAAEAKVPVIKVEPEQLEAGTWVGQSAANLRELFRTARELAPVIIFVEDFDRFAGVRGRFSHTKKQDRETFINQLLVELDGFEKQDGVVLLATTRNANEIDPALKRPGRMDRIFHLHGPTEEEREKILLNAAKDNMDPEIINFVNWSKVNKKTLRLPAVSLKLVPAALERSAFRKKFLDADELLSYCSWFATFGIAVPNWLRRTLPMRKLSSMLVNHLGLTLTKEDVQSVVDHMESYGRISNGIELLNPPLDCTRETKLAHAVWAAGRGLVALLLPNFDTVEHIWLDPNSWEGMGFTKITAVADVESDIKRVESISYHEKKLVFCFGSYAASQMLLPFGEDNLLSQQELKMAQQIATKMVLREGWGPDETPVIYLHGDAKVALSLGNRHQLEVAGRVWKLYDLAYDTASNMLKKNRRVLEKIVDDLIELGNLSGKDLAKIMEENGGIRESEPFSLSRVYESEPLSMEYLNCVSSSATALSGTPTAETSLL